MEKPTVTKRSFIGTVISAKMNKTVVARVDAMKLNAKYQKKYRAENENHFCRQKHILYLLGGNKINEILNRYFWVVKRQFKKHNLRYSLSNFPK